MEEKIIIGIIAVTLILLVIVVVADTTSWSEFKKTHNCKIISKESSSTSLGIGINPKGGTTVVPIITPGKIGYLCNDGVTYYR